MGIDAAAAQERPVVVGVDGSRTTTGTVDLAAAEAVRRRTALVMVHVWPGRYSGVYGSRSALPSPADGRRLLEAVAQRAHLVGPHLTIDTELVDGSAANVLTCHSRGAGLLVIGHRDQLPNRAGWGSTAAYLAHHSASPLLVRRGMVPRDGPVVVAASAQQSGDPALGYAFTEAALRGARLVAVHMWMRPGAADGSAPVIVPGGYAAERKSAEQALATALADWSARFPEVRVDQLVVSDLDMAYTIAGASRRGRLLVAGIGRHARFAELLYGWAGMGGTAGLQRTTCPVVLVPPGWSTGDELIALSGPGKAPPH